MKIISHNILHVNMIICSMSACRSVFVLCNNRWRTYVVSVLRNIEVYAIQGCNKRIVNVSFLGPRDSVLFIEVSVFQGVRISGFHCISNDHYDILILTDLATIHQKDIP